jgi:hypothetical protein
MNFNVVVEAEAKFELLDAAARYEGERSGLGGEFLDDVQAMLDRIEENPFQFQAMDAEIRRALSRRFPYFIYFKVSGDVARVNAVLHQHRGPDVVKSRIRRGG